MKSSIFATRLTTLLQEKKLKQIELVRLAEEKGIKLGKSYISQYLSGKTIPRKEILQFLADTFEVDADWLLGKEIKKSKLIGKIGDNMNISSMIDKNWKIYQNELFPDQWNYQKIQNQRIIEDLQAKGDVNTKLHIVSHFISFPLDKKEEANNLAAKAKTWKYYVEQVEEEEGVVKVVFSKKSKTDIESITTVTNEVMNLAKEFGGEYVEWSTRVMRD